VKLPTECRVPVFNRPKSAPGAARKTDYNITEKLKCHAIKEAVSYLTCTPE
jgi:hypothetical protein